MRIAYLACVFPPYPGGIGVAAEGMAQEMIKRGHKVTVVAPHTMRPWLRYGNAAFLPQLLWRLRNFDIVHLLYPFYGAAEFVPLLRKFSKAKIVVHHTMDAVDTGWRGKFFGWHTRYLMPHIFRAADRVLVLSEDYYHHSELACLSLSPEKLAVVPNGVDTELFHPKLSTTHHPPPTILFVGGLDRAHYFKGVSVLIEACRILKERGVRFVCRIVGEGDLRREYEKMARDAGLLLKTENRKQKTGAEFIGLVLHDELPHFYQEAAVCVVPSTERIECFSIAAAEAQACGIPAIVSNFPGVRVTVEDGKTGYVVRPGDPEDLANRIQELVENPEKARAMGTAGQKRAQELYSWNTIGETLEHIYASLRNQ